MLVFQSYDETTDDALDIVAQRYTVSGTVTASATTPTTLLKVPAMTMTGYPFMTDNADRLWVAVPGATSTTYVVIARVPM